VFIGRLPLRKTDKLGQLPLLTDFRPELFAGGHGFYTFREEIDLLLFLAAVNPLSGLAVSGDAVSEGSTPNCVYCWD